MEKAVKTAKVSDYRNKLATYHKNILEDHDPIRISGLEGDVVILPADDYENLLENIYVMRDKTTIRSINESRVQHSKGKLKGISIEKAFADVLEHNSKQTGK